MEIHKNFLPMWETVYGNSQKKSTYVGDYVCGNSQNMLLPIWETMYVETHKIVLPMWETMSVEIHKIVLPMWETMSVEIHKICYYLCGRLCLWKFTKYVITYVGDYVCGNSQTFPTIFGD